MMKRCAVEPKDSKRSTRRRGSDAVAVLVDRRSRGSSEGSGSDGAAISASTPSSNAGGLSDPSSQETVSVTYPQPKSFAEKLMFVLESNACPETIWWEGNGKTVALKVDDLKKGTVLERFFHGIRYKFFIRNFSRWGFKRDTSFSVPFGQFYYSNSLFQRDKPHLVKHMRMDSDVQDVFARHQASENLDAANGGNGGNSNAPQEAVKKTDEQSSVALPSRSGTSSASTQVEREQMESSLPQDHHHQQQQQGNNEQQQLQDHQGGSCASASQARQATGVNDNANLLSGLLATLVQRSREASSLLPPAVQQANQQQQQPESAELNAARNCILQFILQLVNQYMTLPPPTSPYSAAITSLLQLVQLFVQQYLQPQQSVGPTTPLQQLLNLNSNNMSSSLQQQQPGDATTQTNNMLLMLLLQSVGQQTMASFSGAVQQASAQQAPAPAAASAPQQQQEQQQQQPAQGRAQAQQLQQMLMALEQQRQQSQVQQQLQPQQQTPQWQQQQQQPVQGQQSLSGEIFMQQSLMAQQQQQHNNNNNQPRK